MFWIVLAILIIVVWIIYSRRKGSVMLNKDQAEMVGELCRKEKIELEKKMQDMVDKDALQGKTVPVESIGKVTADMSEDVKKGVISFKQSLLDKYGPNIPINTAHRISWELEGNGKMWSDNPGCFERHLQRRDGNPLFPPERRIVIRKEIEEALEKDRIDQEHFLKKVNELNAKIKSFGGQITGEQSSAVIKGFHAVMEEGAAIGGKAIDMISDIEKIENTLIQQIVSANPKVKDNLETLQALASTERIPFLAQTKKKDTPILKSEELPTLLSEDLWEISILGDFSRKCDPDFHPNEMDVRSHLEQAIEQGFSKERAARIIAAWNEGKNK